MTQIASGYKVSKEKLKQLIEVREKMILSSLPFRIVNDKASGGRRRNI